MTDLPVLRPRRALPAAALALLAVLAMALTGCGHGGREAAAGSGPVSGVPSVTPTELPPGDPGPDAPPMADPGAPAEREDETPRTTVPEDAVLDTETVAGTLGGTWAPARAPGDSCSAPRPAGPVATRTVALVADPRMLVQTVSTHATPAAGKRAVDALARRLRGCGWKIGTATPLGEASVQATRDGGRETVLVLAAEGVTVTLLGTGGTAGNADAWDSLADLALSSSCPAAPDGCH